MVETGKGKAVLGITALKKIPVIIGCLLFLFSVVLPFYHITGGRFGMDVWHPVYFSIDYWSFRSHESGFNMIGMTSLRDFSSDYWFYDYWFKDHANRILAAEPDLSWMLITTFAVQIATLVASFVSVLINKSKFLLVSIFLNLVAIALFSFAGNRFSEIPKSYDDYYETGYWLTYLSLFMFLIAFLTDLIIRRKQKINPKNITKTL
jgi:hypothetical protein